MTRSVNRLIIEFNSLADRGVIDSSDNSFAAYVEMHRYVERAVIDIFANCPDLDLTTLRFERIGKKHEHAMGSRTAVPLPESVNDFLGKTMKDHNLSADRTVALRLLRDIENRQATGAHLLMQLLNEEKPHRMFFYIL